MSKDTTPADRGSFAWEAHEDPAWNCEPYTHVLSHFEPGTVPYDGHFNPGTWLLQEIYDSRKAGGSRPAEQPPGLYVLCGRATDGGPIAPVLMLPRQWDAQGVTGLIRVIYGPRRKRDLTWKEAQFAYRVVGIDYAVGWRDFPRALAPVPCTGPIVKTDDPRLLQLHIVEMKCYSDDLTDVRGAAIALRDFVTSRRQLIKLAAPERQADEEIYTRAHAYDTAHILLERVITLSSRLEATISAARDRNPGLGARIKADEAIIE